MFVKQKKADYSKSHHRINVKLTIIYLLLILLFTALIIFL